MELFQAVVQAGKRDKRQAPGRRAQTYGPGANFRGVKLSVSKVLGRLHFNTAAFRGWYKAQLTGLHLQNKWNRPILSQEDLSDDESPKKQLKKLSYFSGQISYRLF